MNLLQTAETSSNLAKGMEKQVNPEENEIQRLMDRIRIDDLIIYQLEKSLE